MANKILLDEQNGTPKQICFRDVTDFGPAAANDLRVGTPTLVQLDMTSVADAAYRQSTKVDLGAVRAPAYAVRAALEFAAGVVAGGIMGFWWGAGRGAAAGGGGEVVSCGGAPSGSAPAGTANAGGVSGADGAYTGYSSNAAASVRQLEHIGVGVVTAQATTTVQIIEVIGRLYPSERYGSLVVLNDSGAAMHSDAAEIHVVLDPIFEEVQ